MDDGNMKKSETVTITISRITKRVLLASVAILVGSAAPATGAGPKPHIVSISISPSSATIEVGQRQQFTVRGSFSDGSSEDVTSAADYRSSDTSVATVNRQGLATAISRGSVTITASYKGNKTGATLTVTSPNRPPLAVDDTATTTAGVPLQIPVLANDSDPDGDPLAVSGFSQGTKGGVGLTGNVATYAPNAEFTGNDAFTYTISDGRGGTATATVRVEVTSPPNHPPVAADDTATTTAGVSIQISVLANDSDPDSDALTVTSFSQGANGKIGRAACMERE